MLLSIALATCTKVFHQPGPTTRLGQGLDAGVFHHLGWEHGSLYGVDQQLGGQTSRGRLEQLPQVVPLLQLGSGTRSTSTREGCLGGLGKIRLRHHSTKLDGEGMRIKVDLNLFGFVLIDVNK